jgi:chromosome segregation ATPase
MAKNTKDLSVADLQRLLDDRKSQLNDLHKQRDKLYSDLANVEQRINSLRGRGKVYGAGRGRKAAKRPKNSKSLRDVVTELLTKNKKGFTLAKLMEKVLKSGYKSNSSDFKNVLYQCLYNADEFTHDAKTGKYVIK